MIWLGSGWNPESVIVLAKIGELSWYTPFVEVAVTAVFTGVNILGLLELSGLNNVVANSSATIDSNIGVCSCLRVPLSLVTSWLMSTWDWLTIVVDSPTDGFNVTSEGYENVTWSS